MKPYQTTDQDISLKGLIEAQYKTQRKFSEDTGIPEVTVNAWVAKKRMPKLDSAITICVALNISLKTLAKSIGLDVSQVPDDQLSD